MSLSVATTPAIAKSTLRVAQASPRSLHTSPPRYGSPLFALAQLSNARETQHLSKLSRLSRVEHSPSLQLIQSSEVIPFAPPAPPKPIQPLVQRVEAKTVTTLVVANAKEPVSNVLKEADLLSVGRAILAEKNAEISRLKKALESEQDRSLKREASYSLDRAKTRERVHNLDSDLQSARVWKWFLLVVGVSYATWVYALEPEAKKYSASESLNASPVNEAAVIPTTPTRPKPAVVVETPGKLPPVDLQPPVTAAPARSSSRTNMFWVR